MNKFFHCGRFGLPLLLSLLLAVSTQASTDKIRVLHQDGLNSLGDYSFGLLKLAVKHTDHSYEIEAIAGEATPARAIELVRSGQLDLLWAGANAEIEDILLPVRIPLYKGLLGHRIFIIHPKNQAKFKGIEKLEDLDSITFGQGTTWPDTDILVHNGLNVFRVNKYPSLFYMVDGGRFDAFPRGVQEPWSEVASRPELDLMVEERVMLVYRMPFYLFVSPNNPQLAADLELGLRRAIANGSFDEYFFSDPNVQNVLDKARLQDRVVIYLENPTLTPETPIDEAELWLDINSLGQRD
jgi:hypothetical protein